MIKVARKWLWMLTAAVVILAIVVGFDMIGKSNWKGETHLIVEFVVTDSITGDAVSNARVMVFSNSEVENPDSKMSNNPADEKGIARRDYPSTYAHGRRSGLGIRKTF